MSRKPWQVFIGFDQREAAAYAVARESVRNYHRNLCVDGVILSWLQAKGLYTRPTERRLGKYWDVISGAYMSTEFSISRFLVPAIAKGYEINGGFGMSGWAIFMDCDVMVRGSLSPLIEALDDDKAVMCVQHNHDPIESISRKMDNQIQYAYPRKNWSSMMAFNLEHEANDALTVELVNTVPGRDLHRFCWLNDEDIGALDPKWNYLVDETEGVTDPVIVHFTNGIPTMPGYANCEYSDEWRAELQRWAA